jgi:hypothetical protein
VKAVPISTNHRSIAGLTSGQSETVPSCAPSARAPGTNTNDGSALATVGETKPL